MFGSKKNKKTATPSSKWNKSFKMDNYIGGLIYIMKCGGLWPINYENYLPKLFAQFSWPINIIFFVFVNFIALHLAILYAITFYHNLQTGTLDEISASFTQTIIYFFTWYILIYFEIYHRKCTAFVNFMNRNFRSRSAKGLSFVTSEPTYSITRKFTIIWLCSCTSGVLQWTIYPLYVMRKIHPLMVWYPFDELISPLYEIVYILQVFGQIAVGLSFYSSGTIFLCCCILVCGQYDILFCSLKNIRYTAMIKNGNCTVNALRKIQNEMDTDNEELNQYYLSYEFKETIDKHLFEQEPNNSRKQIVARPSYSKRDSYLLEYNTELNSALIDCINHHQIILTFCSLLEDFFSSFVLVKSIQATLQICNLAYTATMTVGSLVKYINLSEYLLLTLLELFMFCFGGELLKYQSTKIGDAILRSPWYLCGGPFRRSLSIILINTTKPKIITGGKFFILDYEKLKQIMTASFSYFTLLQKMGAK